MADYQGYFISGSRGKLYLGAFGNRDAPYAMLFLPAFAEEMNLSRAVVARQARLLAAQGWYVVTLDYYGTGDSEGDISEADVALWTEDVAAALAWLRQVDRKDVVLWGLRFGAVLAGHFVETFPDKQPDRLLLWKPVLDGKLMMNQFFRIKQMGEMMHNSGEKKTNWFKAALEGEMVEVAGYPITPQLVRSISALKMADMTAIRILATYWAEPGSLQLSPAVQKLTGTWDVVESLVCESSTFWLSPDCYDSPALLRHTTSWACEPYTSIRQANEVSVVNGVAKANEAPKANEVSVVNGVAKANEAPKANEVSAANEVTKAIEVPLQIASGQKSLSAILHLPGEDRSQRICHLAVVIVVGGPQYRVGSHRQFVLLARKLAAEGIAVLRFDVSGMGDSKGEKKPFDRLDQEIKAAVDCVFEQVNGLSGAVLWGLCDGASASLIYAPSDRRIQGLVLLNPWLENDQAKAKARLTQYYLQRALSVDLWRKMLSGQMHLLQSVREFGTSLRRVVKANKQQPEPRTFTTTSPETTSPETTSPETMNPATSMQASGELPYQQRMLQGFQRYTGETLLVLSGNDLTAKEFELQYTDNQAWIRAAAGARVTVAKHQAADHTFSSAEWKAAVEKQTVDFVRTLGT